MVMVQVALVLNGKRKVIRFDSNGQQLADISVGTGFGCTDIAVDPVSQQFFVCGSRSDRGGGNPIHVAWMFAYDLSGKHNWTAYNFRGPECARVGDMADSHPTALTVVDGKLYMVGDTEGGNTVYRHNTQEPGGKLAPGIIPKNYYTGNMWKAFSSRRALFVGQYDVADGSLTGRKFFLWYDPRYEKE